MWTRPGHIGVNKKVTVPSTIVKTYTGTLAANNASSLKSVTVRKTDFLDVTPLVGWFLTHSTYAVRAPITSVSVSGANYILGYTVGTAFSGGLGTAYTVSNK